MGDVLGAWTTWLWLGPTIGFAALLAVYAFSGWLLFLLGLFSALWDLVYGLLRYGEFRESERTRRLLDV